MEELGILRGHAKLVLLVVRDSAAAGYQELPHDQQPQQPQQPPQQQGQKQRSAGLRAFPQPT